MREKGTKTKFARSHPWLSERIHQGVDETLLQAAVVMENQQQEKDVWGHRAGYSTFYHFRAHERRLCLLHSSGFDCYSKGHGEGLTTSLTPLEMNVHGVHTCFLKEVSDIWGCKKIQSSSTHETSAAVCQSTKCFWSWFDWTSSSRCHHCFCQ